MKKEFDFAPIVKEAIDEFLTPRQQEILIMSASGMRNYEIADELNISPNTVKNLYYGLENEKSDRCKRGIIGGVMAMTGAAERPSRQSLVANLIKSSILI